MLREGDAFMGPSLEGTVLVIITRLAHWRDGPRQRSGPPEKTVALPGCLSLLHANRLMHSLTCSYQHFHAMSSSTAPE